VIVKCQGRESCELIECGLELEPTFCSFVFGHEMCRLPRYNADLLKLSSDVDSASFAKGMSKVVSYRYTLDL